MTNIGEEVKRTYDSPLRREQARATRRTVVAAAGRLFAERGYVATSVDAIAAEAGVSRATVFSAVGGKPALLKQAYDVAIVGDDAPVSLVERPRSQRILGEPDPYRLLAEYAALCTEIHARVAGIYEAVRGAAPADDEVNELWETINQQRRGGSATLARALADRGPLREGLGVDSAGDVMWVLNDPGLYHMLVHRRRWSKARFGSWLAQAMQTQLLPPPGSGPARARAGRTSSRPRRGAKR